MSNLQFDDKATSELLTAYQGMEAETEKERVKEELIRIYLPLVKYLANKYKSRGEKNEDLIQVGCIGLLKSIERFDLQRGFKFTTYATPTIIGEIKRHFRDKCWDIKIPRRLQGLNALIRKTIDELRMEFGHEPSISEVAERLGIDEYEAVEALEAANGYKAISLDSSPENHDGDDFSLFDYLACEEKGFSHIEYSHIISQAIKDLDSRDRKIFYLRFEKDLSQTEIAEMFQISQMHVSRILQRVLASIRSKYGRVKRPELSISVTKSSGKKKNVFPDKTGGEKMSDKKKEFLIFLQSRLIDGQFKGSLTNLYQEFSGGTSNPHMLSALKKEGFLEKVENGGWIYQLTFKAEVFIGSAHVIDPYPNPETVIPPMPPNTEPIKAEGNGAASIDEITDRIHADILEKQDKLEGLKALQAMAATLGYNIKLVPIEEAVK